MIAKELPVFRLSKSPAKHVTDDYISVMFSDLISLLKKQEEKKVETKTETKANKDCIVS
jgi:hypothetical protein